MVRSMCVVRIASASPALPRGSEIDEESQCSALVLRLEADYGTLTLPYLQIWRKYEVKGTHVLTAFSRDAKNILLGIGSYPDGLVWTTGGGLMPPPSSLLSGSCPPAYCSHPEVSFQYHGPLHLHSA